MSRTLSLVCEDCMDSLWVGQESQSVGWYLYGSEDFRVARNRFVNDHFGHLVRFVDSEHLGFDVNEVEYSPTDDT